MSEKHQRSKYKNIVSSDPAFKEDYASFKSCSLHTLSIWNSIIYNLITYCIENNIDPEDLDFYRSQASSFLFDVYAAFTPSEGTSEIDFDSTDKRKPNKPLWFHQDLVHLATKKVDNKDIPMFTDLDQVVRTYLKTPWLRNSQLDYIFIDAYIWCEIVAFREDIFRFRGDLTPRWAWTFSGDDPFRIPLIQLGFNFLKLLFRYAIPIGILIIFWKNASYPLSKVLLWGTGIYGLYLAYRLIMTPMRFIRWRQSKKEESKRLEMLEEMGKVYPALTLPISVENLRNAVYRARDNGIVFRPGLFSLLDDIHNRGQVVLDPNP
jgi:hypothetical protein